MKNTKHFRITKQTAITACIIFLLLFTVTACGKKAQGEVPSAPESNPSSESGTAPAETSPSSDSTAPPAETVPTPAQVPAEAPSAPANTQSPDAAPSQITLDEAKNAALANAGLDYSAVTFTKEKLDYEDGIAVYEIEFYTSTQEYEYEINAATGAVYHMQSEAFDNGHSSHSQHSGNNHGNSSSGGSNDAASDIGMEAAKSIALEHAGFSASDVTFKKAQSDTEDGQNVYEVEFYKDGREYEYTILAADGTIWEYEVD